MFNLAKGLLLKVINFILKLIKYEMKAEIF